MHLIFALLRMFLFSCKTLWWFSGIWTNHIMLLNCNLRSGFIISRTYYCLPNVDTVWRLITNGNIFVLPNYLILWDRECLFYEVAPQDNAPSCYKQWCRSRSRDRFLAVLVLFSVSNLGTWSWSRSRVGAVLVSFFQSWSRDGTFFGLWCSM